jgi:putative transposase
MANTYTQLYIHYVFAVQNRLCSIGKNWQIDLFKYMTGIIDQQGHKLYVINSMPDHVHILISMSPKQAPSDLMFHLKRSSSLWINQNRVTPGHFSWQEGFGGFTLGKSQVNDTIQYIVNQQEHHRNTTFKEEYLKFLKEYDVQYDERYIFKEAE